MLKRAESLEVFDGVRVKVVQVEDLIGLKIQTLVNNPNRADRDWMDIRMLLDASAEQSARVDWELLADYLEIFRMKDKLSELRAWHGKTH